MDLKPLELIFKIGKYLAITPPSLEADKDEKFNIFPYLMLALYSIGVPVSRVYKQGYYNDFIHIKLVIQTLSDTSLFLFNINAIISAWKNQEKWHLLIKYLKKTQHVAKLRKYCYWEFIVSHFIFWAMIFYMGFVFGRIMGADYFKRYAVEKVQVYSNFLLNVLVFTVLKMILGRYETTRKQIDQLSGEKLKYDWIYLNEIKRNVIILKDLVDVFNEMFGWSILLNLFYICLQVLIYFDSILTESFPDNIQAIISDVNVIIFDCIFIVFNIMLCDGVCVQAKMILSKCNKLTRNFMENEHLKILVETTEKNLPEFSAAGFFIINRTTLFRLFEAVNTIFIVMIQFNLSQNRNNNRA